MIPERDLSYRCRDRAVHIERRLRDIRCADMYHEACGIATFLHAIADAWAERADAIERRERCPPLLATKS